jgi:ribosomal protein S18 acetylase RimI-like enzyme
MNPIIVRKAEFTDLDKLLQFEQGVIQAERPFDPTLKPDPVRYYNIKEMIEADHIELVVAEGPAGIVGSGYARIQQAQHFLVHDKYAYLGFMFVLPEYRGQGINGLILESLKLWAINRGIREMRLEVYCANVSAIKAYEKAGFSQHMIEMRIELQ